MPRRFRTDGGSGLEATGGDPHRRLHSFAAEVVSEGVVVTDPAGLVTYLNPVAQALLGWKLDDVARLPVQHIVSLLDERLSVAVASPFDGCLAAGSPTRPAVATLLVRRDGTLLPVECACHPVIQDGELLGAVLTLRDLRAERQAAAQLKRATADLHQAQKMEAVGQLAAGIAHNFSNLLTVISGDAELALDDPTLSDELRTLLDEIAGASARGASLTRQLMALGRRDELRLAVVPLNDCLEAVHALAVRLIGEDISLALTLDSHAGSVVVDRALFEVALLNLATNARDAMTTGGTLTLASALADLEAHRERPGLVAGRYAVVTVQDTGSGMDDTLRMQIFDPFFTTKAQGLGTGLGLSTVAGIVKQFGGSIFVSSSVGVGTTFTIALPPAPP